MAMEIRGNLPDVSVKKQNYNCSVLHSKTGDCAAWDKTKCYVTQSKSKGYTTWDKTKCSVSHSKSRDYMTWNKEKCYATHSKFGDYSAQSQMNCYATHSIMRNGATNSMKKSGTEKRVKHQEAPGQKARQSMQESWRGLFPAWISGLGVAAHRQKAV